MRVDELFCTDEDHMCEDNSQESTPIMPCMQPSNWRSHIDPRGRQKVIGTIIQTMRRSCNRPEKLSEIEKIARKFEEKVFAEAMDQQDYLRRISIKMKQLEGRAHVGVTNSSMPCSASSVPNPLHSALGDVQSQEPKHTQVPLQTISSAQPQSHQIIPSNTSSSTGLCSVSSSVAVVSSKVIPATGSNSTSQSSSISNISRMPPNLNRNSLEQCVPSKPVALSQVHEQKRQHLQKPVRKNYEKQYLEEKQAPNQPATQNTTRRNIESNIGKIPIQQPQPQPHQDQLDPVQFPQSQQTINEAVAFDRPAIQSSLSSVHLLSEGSSVKPSEKSVCNLPQPVAILQHRSFQDVPHQRKPTVLQKQAIAQQSSSSINRQNQSPLRRLPDCPQKSQQDLFQSKRVHSVQQHQQLSDEKKQYTAALPQRPGAHSTAHHRQQNEQQHALPSMVKVDSLGAQKVSSGFSSSQWAESHKKAIAQPQIQVVTKEKQSSPCLSSGSQNLLGPVVGTTKPGTGSSEAFKTSEVSSYAEKHGAGEAWRENTYERIMAMKSRYMSRMKEIHYMINIKLKQLGLHCQQPKRDQLQKLKEINNMVERILRLLNIPKEKLIPGHEGSLDAWEKQIVHYMKFFKPKITASSLQQGLDPHCESLQASRPHQVVESSGLKEKYFMNQHGTMKTESLDFSRTNNPHRDSHYSLEIRKTTSDPSLPTPTHQSGKAQQPSATQLVISPGISPPPLLSECHNDKNNLLAKSKVISGRTSVNLTPIQRLVNSVSSISHHALKSSIDDICSVMSMVDGMETNASRAGSRSALGQDLARTTLCRIQARSFSLQGGSYGMGVTKPCMCPVPTEIRNDSEKSSHELTTENLRKKPRIEAVCRLWEEIKDVNQRLVDTQVNICEECLNVASVSEEKSGTGTVIKCCFKGASVNPGIIKSLGCSGYLSTIKPLHLLVPTDYPKCSPILLDELPGEIGDEFFDLSNKARSKLDTLLRSFKDPITLSEIARTWEACAHAVVTEHAEKCGGGTLSSRYGTWENCLATA
ncbi:hypothetical protein Cgig2_032080 [Carnegiea gigantea]|uniref:Mediator complex subunit 15 KIX domain-containing protein n=1 Tax=Carnegiea gigantea TaxID=171969 RepID=A0A9Q1JZP4_9CARY|nr:hypothetical protein Cgig2_032080 [Carnegiea gigantea]